MAFGKRGRPPEDRLARQEEIYRAVMPLLTNIGVRDVSMRELAHAACLSIGGLYYYFPTKRDLALFGLAWPPRERLCREHRAKLTAQSPLTFECYLDLYLEFSLDLFRFVQPAVHAALELSVEDFRPLLDEGMRYNVSELCETLSLLIPESSADDLAVLARAIRRLSLGFFFERDLAADELCAQLRALIQGYEAVVRERSSSVLVGAVLAS